MISSSVTFPRKSKVVELLLWYWYLVLVFIIGSYLKRKSQFDHLSIKELRKLTFSNAV
jgi:hypothetical protein